MNFSKENNTEILDLYVSGFRQYILDKSDKSPKIVFVSQNFCNMTGYTKDELTGKNAIDHKS